MSTQHSAYLAAKGFEQDLINELKNIARITHVMGRLMLAEGAPHDAVWAENIWLSPQIIPITSIGDAAEKLRAIQRNWWPYAWTHFRRMELIQKKLPHISAKPLNFLDEIPTSPLGSFTLMDERTLLASPTCSSPMPNGQWLFVEDKINPPSRAYLKLWELFTRFKVHPKKSETCIDLGASPGGWTYVLAALAKHVIAVDRSPLDERLNTRNITFIAKDAFKIELADYPEVDWIFSDVVCFPEKLYEFVSNLIREFPEKKYVFTIKFRGIDHGDIIERFKSLPGQIVHLSNNKHELTWFKI